MHAGQSNPTYLLQSPQLAHGALVLRRKPPGTLLPSAHAVDREFHVLSALAKGSKVPVPKPGEPRSAKYHVLGIS